MLLSRRTPNTVGFASPRLSQLLNGPRAEQRAVRIEILGKHAHHSHWRRRRSHLPPPRGAGAAGHVLKERRQIGPIAERVDAGELALNTGTFSADDDDTPDANVVDRPPTEHRRPRDGR